jgi:sugar phosphate isomerase/epimerase
MKLSCQEQLLPGGSLEEKWEFATGAGFSGIELRAQGGGRFPARLPELRAAARAGVVMATVCPETDHFIGDFDAGRATPSTSCAPSSASSPSWAGTGS